jgi:Tfp pilus assembly protein PilX
MTGSNRGFTLLIAVILASVAIAVGVALSSIAYKSVRLSNVAQGSQYAFYAADSALECALYADQQLTAFDYASHSGTPAPTPQIQCVGPAGTQPIDLPIVSPPINATTVQFKSIWFHVSGARCARLTVSKTSTGTTYIYAEGITNCDTTDPRDIERGIYAHY